MFATINNGHSAAYTIKLDKSEFSLRAPDLWHQFYNCLEAIRAFSGKDPAEATGADLRANRPCLRD